MRAGGEQQPESRIEACATGGELPASGKRSDIVFPDIQMAGPSNGSLRASCTMPVCSCSGISGSGVQPHTAGTVFAWRHAIRLAENFSKVRAIRETALLADAGNGHAGF